VPVPVLVVALDAGACCVEAAAAAGARAGEVREVAGWKSQHLSLFAIGHAALGPGGEAQFRGSRRR